MRLIGLAVVLGVSLTLGSLTVEAQTGKVWRIGSCTSDSTRIGSALYYVVAQYGYGVGVLRIWGNWKDRWDNMVSIHCPTGAHLARRLPIQAVGGRHEIIVTCQQCGHNFAWPVPPK
jgi:hypothetical protein